MIILPVQGPVLPVLHQGPEPQVLPVPPVLHQGPVPQVLPVLQGLQQQELSLLLLSCSLRPRWIKKPTKAR